MTKDDIIRMAREAEFGEFVNMITNPLERFAALVAAHERKECAKVCEEKDGKFTGYHALNCAALIRSRGMQ